MGARLGEDRSLMDPSGPRTRVEDGLEREEGGERGVVCCGERECLGGGDCSAWFSAWASADNDGSWLGLLTERAG